jgi:hypothetical protein
VITGIIFIATMMLLACSKAFRKLALIVLLLFLAVLAVGSRF